MKKGEKAILTCAPSYAYGARGSPPKIPANATLKFEVELLGFKEKEKDHPVGAQQGGKGKQKEQQAGFLPIVIPIIIGILLLLLGFGVFGPRQAGASVDSAV